MAGWLVISPARFWKGGGSINRALVIEFNESHQPLIDGLIENLKQNHGFEILWMKQEPVLMRCSTRWRCGIRGRTA